MGKQRIRSSLTGNPFSSHNNRPEIVVSWVSYERTGHDIVVSKSKVKKKQNRIKNRAIFKQQTQ